jgi:hypothetical protein
VLLGTCGDYERFATVVGLLCQGSHREAEGLAGLVRIAYTTNADGKQRRVPRQLILDRILRGHTLNAAGRGDDMVRPPRRRGELDGNKTV